jgi:hypothetical protein
MDWRKLFGFGRNKDIQTIHDDTALELGFTSDILTLIKQRVPSTLKPLNKNDLYEDGPSVQVGISFKVDEEEAENLVLTLQSEIVEKGYLVFICEKDNKNTYIGMMQGYDQFEILKVQQTNGDNYDISNEMVLSKMREWNHRFPFTIVGANFDWVEANFNRSHSGQELKKLAKEIYKFCPDVVDQGTGSIEELIEEMKQTGKLYLWWD